MALSTRPKSRPTLQNKVKPSAKLIRLPQASALVGHEKVVRAEEQASSDLRHGRFVKVNIPLTTASLMDLAHDHEASKAEEKLELVEQAASNV